MDQENNTDNKGIIDSENIFDEFTTSQDIQDEVDTTEKKKQKDMYYYLQKLSSTFFIINMLAFIILILGAFYIYIQQGEVKKEYSFLSPLCSVFLGNSEITPGTCYGVTPILAEYENRLSASIDTQATSIFPILGDIYSIENFNLSKKVSFLLEKNDTRLQPLDILSSFDALKNTFSPTDKGEISCYDISISANTLSITCDAYSSDWNTDIITLNEGGIETLPGGGTSISRASSFMYFIENYRDSSFVITQKPQVLSSIPAKSGPYTQKTVFTLEMLYTPKENLIF